MGVVYFDGPGLTLDGSIVTLDGGDKIRGGGIIRRPPRHSPKSIALYKAVFEDWVRKLEEEAVPEEAPPPVKKRVKAVAKAVLAEAGLEARGILGVEARGILGKQIEQQVREVWKPHMSMDTLQAEYDALVEQAKAEADDEDILLLM